MNAFAKLIIKDYLGSLKESDELDFLFPILLNLMDFSIISTPKDSKGQSQYGKDIIATGIDEDGSRKRFYFELKGHKAKNLNATNFCEDDGARMSILEAKDAKFEDITIPGFNELPIKIVFVHNGIIQSDFRKTFNDFIEQNFPPTETFYTFERWDVHKLTDLFTEHFFNEHLLVNEKCLRLLRRSIVLIDVHDHNIDNFQKLTNRILEKVTQPKKSRDSEQLFATLNLIIYLIYFYSNENNNLEPAIDCSFYLLLSTWRWMLVNDVFNQKYFLKKFSVVLDSVKLVTREYLKKTFGVAKQKHGLFYEGGFTYEKIGYPIRCFDYLTKVIFYFNSLKSRNIKAQKQVLMSLILNNLEGFSRPLFDKHIAQILSIFRFLLSEEDEENFDEYIIFIITYLESIYSHLNYTFIAKKRLPEYRNNFEALIKFEATEQRPYDYDDTSSYMLTIIIEILAILSEKYELAKSLHQKYVQFIQGKVDLMVFYPNFSDHPIEEIIFEKELADEGYTDISFSYTDEPLNTVNHLRANLSNVSHKTDGSTFPFLRELAHMYFGSLHFPDDWRKIFLNLVEEQ